ncbi:MAG: hypothetical protein AAFU86_08930, partial [Pseudomonadota bacterium]
MRIVDSRWLMTNAPRPSSLSRNPSNRSASALGSMALVADAPEPFARQRKVQSKDTGRRKEDSGPPPDLLGDLLG